MTEPEAKAEADSEADSEPESAPQAAPASVAPSSPPWQPPDTLSEKFSRGSRKLIRFLLVACSLVFLVGVVLWAIPSIAVARSADYAVAVEAVQKDRSLRSFLGTPLICERVPTRYTLREGGASFALVVDGSYGRALAQVEVQDGKAVRKRVHYSIDWTRPLDDQLVDLRQDR